MNSQTQLNGSDRAICEKLSAVRREVLMLRQELGLVPGNLSYTCPDEEEEVSFRVDLCRRNP